MCEILGIICDGLDVHAKNMELIPKVSQFRKYETICWVLHYLKMYAERGVTTVNLPWRQYSTENTSRCFTVRLYSQESSKRVPRVSVGSVTTERELKSLFNENSKHEWERAYDRIIHVITMWYIPNYMLREMTCPYLRKKMKYLTRHVWLCGITESTKFTRNVSGVVYFEHRVE